VETDFTVLVGCRLPLQLAGMGGVTTVELVSAVCEAGGLGMLNLSLLGPDEVRAELDRLGEATAAPWGVNFIVPFLDLDVLEQCAAQARVVELFYGDPEPSVVERAHACGALVSWQVGSAAEARSAADAGCDLVVAQGVEAGGHVRGSVGLLPLLDAVLGVVDVPVVAAGGIGTGRAVAAALAAGASAARVGTRFVAAAESGAHPDYVAALVAASAGDTVLTEAFSVFWPGAPHRVLRHCVDELARVTGDTVGEATVGGRRMALPKGAAPTPDRSTTGNIAAMPLYAGQSVEAVRRVQPAAEIVDELMSEAARLLSGLTG
jgi:NAD(P)H-dependent flavin oxidoreductase YrpB (nitropropane dioxygenase family)